jgi:hypothetical protein
MSLRLFRTILIRVLVLQLDQSRSIPPLIFCLHAASLVFIVDHAHPCGCWKPVRSGMQMLKRLDEACGAYTGQSARSCFTRSCLRARVGPTCQDAGLELESSVQ